ncbi:MAG: Dabb family protein [Lachnospiraceae bacterium]|jgi:hypothetical protein|nr:Dabb family protein [Lachnospiraceae bacterium]MEE3461695.1 Dabb family protein [Lachnospiraceae bacterium]
MVKHIIVWNLKSDMDDVQKENVKAEIKRGLENLNGRIADMESLKVYDKPMDGSDGDIALECVFKSEEALKMYQGNPDHVKVRDEKIKPYISSRVCFDTHFNE